VTAFSEHSVLYNSVRLTVCMPVTLVSYGQIADLFSGGRSLV